MGIHALAVILAMVGVMTGSTLGATTPVNSASSDLVKEPPKMVCVYAGDCDRDQVRIQDCVNTCDCTQDQLRKQEFLQVCDATLDQVRTQDQIRLQDCNESSLYTQSQLRVKDQTCVSK